MGFRFKKSVKIMPGVRINIGKKGSSLSVGRRGASVNINKHGTRTTLGIPGTGLSHSSYSKHKSGRISRQPINRKRPVTLFMIALVLILLFAMFAT